MLMNVDFKMVDLRAMVNSYVKDHYEKYVKEVTDEGGKPMEIWRVSNNMHQLLAMHYFMHLPITFLLSSVGYSFLCLTEASGTGAREYMEWHVLNFQLPSNFRECS